ncbi:MAG: intracellular septation protein [Alphaproteobacteria bacterium]|nr:intracellular septation protein [Alphaproteobacteria bacterium]
MKGLFLAMRGLLLDLVSTLFFLALYALTHNVLLAVSLGMAAAFLQIGWQLAHKKRVFALQWVSLFLVAAAGGATLFTENPIFVMLKPSAIYVLVGISMLERGWLTRYMPPRALQLVPDMIIRFGYVWAGLMFVTAALNIALAVSTSVETWGSVMTVWGIGSKVGLFAFQYALMKTTGKRRYRAQMMMA